MEDSTRTGSSIFTRLILASLAPFAVFFIVLSLLFANAIYRGRQNVGRENVKLLANIAAERITSSLSNISRLLHLTASNMAEAVDSSAAGREAVEHLLVTFMQSNPEVYCAWYVFEPGTALDSNRRHARSFQNIDDRIVEIPAVREESLTDPAVSPWHVVPLRTGEMYRDIVDFWDYGTGKGLEYAGTIAFPVVRDGETIGSVGMDILYERAMSFMDSMQTESRAVILFNNDGRVIYSPEGGLRNKTLDDLEFRDRDREKIARALADNQPLLLEMHSPLFNRESLVQLFPIPLPKTDDAMFIYMDVPTSAAYRDAKAYSLALALACLAGLAILGACVFLAVRSIIRPINRISRFADTIAGGDLGAKLELGKSSREVGVLSDSINKMLDGLNQNHQLTLRAVRAEHERRKIEDSEKERSLFFANMSHEIRTPMNAILGMADLLAEENLSDRQGKYVKDIRVSAESLLVIINDILDISRLESGKLALVKRHFDLSRLLENIRSIASHLAGKRGLEFEYYETGSIPRFFFGDEIRLRQILLNLLSNAVKFTDKGFVRLIATCRENRLVFDVADTGVGIRKEERDSLFSAFRQLDVERNRRTGGTGLGLSITMSLVKLMGGELGVESVYEKGSTFRVSLPLTPGDPARVDRSDEEPAAQFRFKASALVVDDNEINLGVARGLLELYGLRCVTADSGEMALLACRKENFDIIFMDHMMPGMDGVETTRRIRKLGSRAAKTPVIALTANAVLGVREQLLSSGMDDYVSKPIQRAVLIKKLAKWLPEDRIARDPFRRAPTPTPGLDWLRGVPGLDVDKGLERLDGQEEAYMDIVKVARGLIPEIAGRIQAAFAGGDLDGVRREAHGVKSALASLGADSAAGMAADLERAAAAGDGDFCRLNLPAFVDSLESLAAGMNAGLEREAAE